MFDPTSFDPTSAQNYHYRKVCRWNRLRAILPSSSQVAIPNKCMETFHDPQRRKPLRQH